MTTTETTTNNLVYKTSKTVNGKTIYVTIRLNDECKNGHEDFSITGDIYKAGLAKTDRNYISGGCIHNDILKHFPQFKIFVDLHLSDFNGVPMYAIENGYYHLRNSTKDITKNHLRITEEEFNELNKVTDKLSFTALLFDMNIVSRWKKEADEAIKILEELTGQNFKSTATKAHIYEMSKEDKDLFNTRTKEGYYTEETTQKRIKKEIEEKKQAQITKLKNEAKKEINNIEKERDLKIYIINKGLSIDNVIYYNHINECVFNWSDNSYNKKITQEEFNKFLENKDLPNVKFILK